MRTAFTTLILALSAAASATILPRDDCSTGGVQCCSNVQNVNTTGVAEILSAFSLLGLPLNIGAILGATGTLIGLSCSSVSAVGAGGNSCSTQPVCCTDNYQNGVLATGCNPINV